MIPAASTCTARPANTAKRTRESAFGVAQEADRRRERVALQVSAGGESLQTAARGCSRNHARQRRNTMLREHAFDSVRERRLFSLAIPSASALPRPTLPAGNFACLLAWDARGVSADVVSAVVEPLLWEGASYFVCWGPDCERVHDIIDEIVSSPDNDFGVPEDSCIMTTSHASGPLRDALWFFLVNSWPDEHYQDSTHAGLAISIGSSAWAAEIAEALADAREFIRRGSENGAA